MGHKTTRGAETMEPIRGQEVPESEKKKLDLSAAQVAGSSLATVAAALLASKLGVYGTILGAGVVSVVATAGGPVIGHFFRRTGDQLRETARPRARQVPVADPAPGGPPPGEEFGRATTHGTRVRGWKRTAVAAGTAFAVSLGGIAAYEALSGGSVGDRPLYTAVTGGSGSGGGKQDPPAGPDGRPSPGAGGEREHGEEPGAGSSPSPSRSRGGQDPSPAPSPSRSTGPTPSPAPSRSADPTPTPPRPTPPPEKPSPATGGGESGGPS
ncbi:hypothetical protein ABT084_17895 [Streptomyces sp. NPDC002138]|uniref:hypothetical protein n=1 Tax=Streptomyces sp. NPDC002138 TaxID=3154410 RepID=UPI00331DC64A